MDAYGLSAYQRRLNWYWYERGLEDGKAGRVLGETSSGYWYQEGYSQGRSARLASAPSENNVIRVTLKLG